MATKMEFEVVDCLVEKDGKFLLVREGRPGRSGLYNLPGGHVEGTETLAEAAVREVKEESGYVVEVTGFVGIYQSIFVAKQLNVSVPVFHGQVVSGASRITEEHPEVRWVAADEFLELCEQKKFWTNHPEQLMRDYLRRGSYPIDVVASGSY